MIRPCPMQDKVFRWLHRNLGRRMELEDLAEACGTTVGTIKVTVWKLRQRSDLRDFEIIGERGRGHVGYHMVRRQQCA